MIASAFCILGAEPAPATDWESAWIIVVKLAVVLLLVVLNGLFVASEFAIVKVRDSQLQALADQGERRAGMARHVTAHLDAYLSATQLGITLASLGLGWLGEEYLAAMLEPAFFKMNITSHALIESVSFALAFFTITFLHIVLGELAPKSLAIRRAVPTTLWVTRPLNVFYVAFKPLIWVLNGAANWILRNILRIEPATEGERAHSEEELRLILADSRKAEEVSEVEKQMLLNVLDLRHRVAREIMTPRAGIVFLRVQDSFAENLQKAKRSGHTRFPLCDRDLDHSLGFIHLKDILGLIDQPAADLNTAKRPLATIPEMMPLPQLLNVFLAQHGHMALVLDEYGGTVGMVTLENVLEQVVGEIEDEFDTPQLRFRRLKEGEFIVSGMLPLYRLRDLAGIDLEDADVSTIGGYVTAVLGRLPVQGDQLTIRNFSVTVMETDNRRVRQLRFSRREPDTARTPHDSYRASEG